MRADAGPRPAPILGVVDATAGELWADLVARAEEREEPGLVGGAALLPAKREAERALVDVLDALDPARHRSSGVCRVSPWTRRLYSRSIHAAKASWNSSRERICDAFTSATKAALASRLNASILPCPSGRYAVVKTIAWMPSVGTRVSDDHPLTRDGREGPDNRASADRPESPAGWRSPSRPWRCRRGRARRRPSRRRRSRRTWRPDPPPSGSPCHGRATRRRARRCPRAGNSGSPSQNFCVLRCASVDGAARHRRSSSGGNGAVSIVDSPRASIARHLIRCAAIRR